MHKVRTFVPALALALVATTATASAPIDAGWPEVASVRDGDCALTVTGNGQFYRIEASGLGAEAPGRLFLANGDMTPLDWSIRAAGDGGFARYYLPFRWHRNGGEVLVSVRSARCDLVTTFAWERARVVVR